MQALLAVYADVVCTDTFNTNIILKEQNVNIFIDAHYKVTSFIIKKSFISVVLQIYLFFLNSILFFILIVLLIFSILIILEKFLSN